MNFLSEIISIITQHPNAISMIPVTDADLSDKPPPPYFPPPKDRLTHSERLIR